MNTVKKVVSVAAGAEGSISTDSIIHITKDEINSESKKIKKAKMKNKLFGASITLGPMSLWTVLFFLFPLFYVIYISFCVKGSFGKINHTLSLSNYIRLFNPTYMSVIISSFRIALISTLIVIAVAFPYAYFVSRCKKKKMQGFLIFLIMIPFWSNSLLRTYALMTVLSTKGLINSLLMNIGIIHEPIQMMYTDFAVYLGMISTRLPFMILPLYSNLQKLDPALLEAGRDLGCSNFQLFWKVIFPISIPGLMAGTVLVFVPVLGNFFVTDALGGSKSIVIGNVIQNQFGAANDWPFGSAVSVLLMVLSCVFISINSKLSEEKGRRKA